MAHPKLDELLAIYEDQHRNPERAATETRTASIITTRLQQLVIDPGPVPGSEDVGQLAAIAGVPCVYWLLGGADPAARHATTTPAYA